MKKTLLILLGILSGILSSYSQSGAWSGKLKVQGMEIPVIFHLDDSNPTLDSPAQGAKGIPMSVSRPAADSISVTIPSIGAAYSGKHHNGEIKGTFTQRGYSFPLTLTPGVEKPRRPQTPAAPFPYTQEEVSFSNGGAVLRGTLSLPEGYNRDTPVLLMITGSGLQNRDEEMFSHRPFAVIADALARKGIATLRYDDRGFGESTGDAVNCTTLDLMRDAESGIYLLRQRFNNVGVLGHSEGGTIAFMLGAEKKVDFIVSLAGMTVSGKEALIDQNRLILSRTGYPREVVDEYCKLLESAFNKEEAVSTKLAASDLPDELRKNLQAVLWQIKSPYMLYFLELDVRDRLGKVGCPVLALNGKKDTQVNCEINLGTLEKGLPPNDSHRVIAIDDLNHLFQPCTTGLINEYATIEETISPEVLALIIGWIDSLPLK